MSVDYYSCDCCGDAVYEEFVHSCAKCGRNICEDCFNKNVDIPERINYREDITDGQYEYLCNKYGKETIDKYVIGYGELNPEYCPFCNGDKVDSDDLLEFVLERYIHKSLDEIKEEYRNIKK